VLTFQFNVTLCCIVTGSAVAVKFTAETFAPFIATDAVDGVKLYPDWPGVTTYEPFARPEKLYAPEAFVVVEPVEAPASVTVAAEPVTVPEIEYVVETVDPPPDDVDPPDVLVAGTNARSTQ
jgi:hypothetical protein